MDALKKAEEEKKQAAKRLQEVEMEAREISNENNLSDEEHVVKNESSVPELFTETSQFSLEPLSLTEQSDETKGAALVDNDVSIRNEMEVATVDASEAFSEDLTMENMVSEGIAGTQETFEKTQNAIDLSDTTIIEGLSTENVSAPFDDTFHGVIFDEEEQSTEVYEETLPGVPADQLARDLGGGEFQPTPVAAQTVFSAGRTNKKHNSFKWGVFVILILLAAGSFSIFYYFTITPVARNMPSPLIVRGIESIQVAPPIIASSEAEIITGTVASAAIEESQTRIIEEIIEIPPIQNEVMVSVNDTELTGLTESMAEKVEPDMKETDEVISIDEKKVVEEIVQEVNEALIVDEPVKDKRELEQNVEPLPETIDVNASLISISKSKTLEQENAMVNQAFKAYQQGHYDAAKSLYKDVLKKDADNRDAHLGLAAIAIGKQDRKNAYLHYVHLLELNPADTLAMNALISLSNSADPVKDESAIKLLIQRDGDVPYLYFSLGNLYAKQKRWLNAQQAFFDAYRLDLENAGYVLNLAISLDQIGQYDTALDYYKTAIELSKNSSAKFDFVSVNNRILVLSKLLESKS